MNSEVLCSHLHQDKPPPPHLSVFDYLVKVIFLNLLPIATKTNKKDVRLQTASVKQNTTAAENLAKKTQMNDPKRKKQ